MQHHRGYILRREAVLRGWRPSTRKLASKWGFNVQKALLSGLDHGGNSLNSPVESAPTSATTHPLVAVGELDTTARSSMLVFAATNYELFTWHLPCLDFCDTVALKARLGLDEADRRSEEAAFVRGLLEQT
eukprot:scpid77859/ scgid31023/ 